MNTIGNIDFPETPEEARAWEKRLFVNAVHHKVLFVAVTRVEGDWAAYCVPVPGKSHDTEKHLWQHEGTKLLKNIAESAFPFLKNIPYAY